MFSSKEYDRLAALADRVGIPGTYGIGIPCALICGEF